MTVSQAHCVIIARQAVGLLVSLPYSYYCPAVFMGSSSVMHSQVHHAYSLFRRYSAVTFSILKKQATSSIWFAVKFFVRMW